MTEEEIKSKITNFLRGSTLCVISTIDTEGNKPEAAVVGFAETEQLELIFGTSNTTRKYKNIKINPYVSFVVGWDGRVGTVQYEGLAEELSAEATVTYSTILIAKNPHSAKMAEREDQRYFLVKPKWIRLVDMSKKPDETFDVKF